MVKKFNYIEHSSCVKLKATERDIQLTIQRYLFRTRGYYGGRCNTVGIWDAKKDTYRKNPYAFNGMPDIMCVASKFDELDDKFKPIDYNTFQAGYENTWWIVIEVKSAKGKLSHKQEMFKWYWESCRRHIYILARDIDDILKAGL